MSADVPVLSVVVGSVESARSIDLCLASIGAACTGLRVEVLVLDASRDDTADRAERHPIGARVVRRPAGTLTPELWAEGFRLSSGRAVAFTTGHCIVPTTWAHALLHGLAHGDAGVGGAIAVRGGTSIVDWAVFYLRYSAYLDAGRDGRRVVKDILGDNAAYRRDALERHRASFAHGFWELDFHERLKGEGETVAFVPGADVAFGPSFPFASILAHRFAHGRHYGAWRVATGARPAWAILLGAPLVPALLLARIAARVLPRPAHRVRFAAAAPVLLALGVAWAAGEALGAAFGWRPSHNGAPVRQHA